MKSPKHKPAAGSNDLSFEAEFTTVLRFLMEKHGPLLDREAIVKVFRFPSGAAYDRCRQRGQFDLHLVRVPNRSGFFASAHDAAKHLVQMTRQEKLAESQKVDSSAERPSE